MTRSRPATYVTPTEDRFRALFARHYPAVYGYAARRVGASDAEDVAGEVFTIAWRRLRSVPDGDESLLWLYGVARRVVANSERARRRRERLDALVARAGVPVVPAADAGGSVLSALDDLSEADKEILCLAAWEGLGPGEMGAVVGCSANAAAVRLHRARRRLAEALEGDTP